jgi:hypothetical protein
VSEQRDLAAVQRWPPILWLGIYLGSLFILVDSRAWWMYPIGAVGVLGAFIFAVRMATKPEPNRPLTRGTLLALAGVGIFYAICAVVASTAGWQYGLVAAVAGTLPGTAVALIVAGARRKTRAGDDRLLDESRDRHDDPYPAIGMDDETPVGTTTEHSDAEGDPAEASRRRRGGGTAQPTRHASTRGRS